MRARLVPIFALIMAFLIARSEAGEPEREPLPQPATGWSIELAARAPRICNPTSIVVAADGTIYLGQGPDGEERPGGRQKWFGPGHQGRQELRLRGRAGHRQRPGMDRRHALCRSSARTLIVPRHRP